jgi:hypothetical protein
VAILHAATCVCSRRALAAASVMLLHVATGRKITVTMSALDTPMYLGGATLNCP